MLSPLGQSYLAGLLQYAVPSTVFATPTVNGYRRFKPNSLAPDRATWAYDHRGAMIRVLGGLHDPATRLENRMGEPAANPYLFILSQVVAGLAGVTAKLRPPPATDEPYAAERPMLPKNLPEALDALEKGRCSAASSAIFHRLLRQAQAHRSRALSALAEGQRRSGAKRRAEHLGAE